MTNQTIQDKKLPIRLKIWCAGSDGSVAQTRLVVSCPIKRIALDALSITPAGFDHRNVSDDVPIDFRCSLQSDYVCVKCGWMVGFDHTYLTCRYEVEGGAA